jgi:hypothetical protein
MSQATITGPFISAWAKVSLEREGKGARLRRAARVVIENWNKLFDIQDKLGFNTWHYFPTAAEVAKVGEALGLGSFESIRKRVFEVAERTTIVRPCNLSGKKAQTWAVKVSKMKAPLVKVSNLIDGESQKVKLSVATFGGEGV